MSPGLFSKPEAGSYPLSPAELGGLVASDDYITQSYPPGRIIDVVPAFYAAMSDEELASRCLHRTLVENPDFIGAAVRRVAVFAAEEGLWDAYRNGEQ